MAFSNKVNYFRFRFPARLDGVSETAMKKMVEQHKTIDDWLELSEFKESNPLDEKGKRRVSLIVFT